MLRAAALVALAATAVPASAQFIGKLEFAEGRRITAEPGDSIHLTARIHFSADNFTPGQSALGGYRIRVYGTGSPHYEINDVDPAFTGARDERMTDKRTLLVSGVQIVVGADPSEVNTSAQVDLVSFDVDIDDHWDGRPIVLNLTQMDYRPRNIGYYPDRSENTVLTGPVVSGFFIIEPPSTEEPEEPTADMDGDGQVNVSDLIAFLTAFGASNMQADVNGDDQVNVSDLIAFLGMFGAAN